MNVKDLLNDLIVEFSKQFQKGDLSTTDRIYCNFWKKDILDALHAHDFDHFPITCENLATWFIRYGHVMCEIFMCEDPKERNARERLKMSNTLRIFSPRSTLLSALAHKSPRKNLYQICNEISHHTESQLNTSNYVEYFQLLLEMEDVEILLDYLRLVQHDVEITKCASCYFRIRTKQSISGRSVQEVVSPNVDEIVIIPKNEPKTIDTTLVEHCVKVLIPNDGKILKTHVATVKAVTESEVIFEAKLGADSLKNSFDLIFRPTRFPIRYQYRSLNLLSKNDEMRKYLFPERNLLKPQTSDCNNNNLVMEQSLINKKIFQNPEQLAAVSQITFGRIMSNAPFIIFGPPGTGKTTTIVESILQLRLQQPDSRILVTAGSNSACDTIALRICEYFKSSQCLEAYLENATVLPLLRIYSKSVVDRGIQNLPKELRQHSNIEWLSGEHAYPAVEDIHRYGIIIATLCTVGKLVCGNVSSPNFFTHVFIDEAGAASEPETLVGVIGIKNEINDNCRIILSGDHKQLGPVIKSDQAVKLGLGKSLMQRLLERDCYAVRNGEYDRSLQIRLRRNYRSHREIVELYNRLYYGKELKPMAIQNDAVQTKWSFLRNPSFPIAFHAVCGEMTKNGTTSSCNMLEVQVVISYVSLLLKADRVNQNDIGVITPYRLQSERIKSRLEERNMCRVEVGSVEYFQGREKPIVIASMVRSKNGLGFIKNRKRLNVLLSRPKILLIILGEPTTLSAFSDMKYIIETCKSRGNYYDEKNNTFGQMGNIPLEATQKNSQKKKSKYKKKVKKNSAKNGFKALLETSSNLSKESTKSQAGKDDSTNLKNTENAKKKKSKPSKFSKIKNYRKKTSKTKEMEEHATTSSSSATSKGSCINSSEISPLITSNEASNPTRDKTILQTLKSPTLKLQTSKSASTEIKSKSMKI